MTSQIAKFSCAGADELVVAVRASKKQIKLSVRHWIAATEKMQTGMVEYFELGQDVAAQKQFDARVEQAEAAGWLPLARTSRPAEFAVMPTPPSKPVEAKTGPRAAAGGRR